MHLARFGHSIDDAARNLPHDPMQKGRASKCSMRV